jgi:hypothetical protein
VNGHKKLDSQLNLPLCQTRPLDLPADKQSELSAALADLLWNAAVETDYSAIDTPGDEA